MTDYQKYINALRKCAKEHENDRTLLGYVIVSDLCRDTANLLEVIEQKPILEYTKPLNCTVAPMQFQEYRSKRFLPTERPYDAGFIALFKRELAKDLFEGIKENITYEVDAECMTPTITASVFVGRKRG